MAPRTFAVIPAAGRSRRMGSPKLLLPWKSARVIDSVLTAYRESRVETFVLVAHPADTELIAAAKEGGAAVVALEPPPSDMKESVQRGLHYLAETAEPNQSDAWLLAPADMPLLSADIINQLIAADQSGDKILAPKKESKRGHPVLFRWSLAAQVFTLKEEEGVNALVAKHNVTDVAIEHEGAYADMDTPTAYKTLRQQ